MPSSSRAHLPYRFWLLCCCVQLVTNLRLPDAMPIGRRARRESSFCQKLRPEYTFVRSFSGGGQPLPRWRYISKSTQMDRRFLTTLGLVLILVPTASASFGLDSESGFGCGSTHITASGFSCGSRLTLWRRGVIYDPNLDMAV